ncbi:hypothetical protein LZC95_38920 [Pendulispora brunnea]|uniref:Uncharacterized protein n=1 Tax=Pendulispora brunnea TaxID=2905690 RepID=A0ABZ2K1C7_9BACT
MRTWVILVAMGGVAGCGLIANIDPVQYESDAGIGAQQEAGPGGQGDADVKDAGARDATDWRKSTDFCGHFDASITYFCSDFELGADVEDEGWTRNSTNRADISFGQPGHSQSQHATWLHREANTTEPVTVSWSTSIQQAGRSTFLDMSVFLPGALPDGTVWAQFEPGVSSGCQLQFMARGVRLMPAGTELAFTQTPARDQPVHLYVDLQSTGAGNDQLSVEWKGVGTILGLQSIACRNQGISRMSFGVHGNDAHGTERSVGLDNVAIGIPQ